MFQITTSAAAPPTLPTCGGLMCTWAHLYKTFVCACSISRERHPSFGRFWVYLSGGPKFCLHQSCSAMDLNISIPPWWPTNCRKRYSNTMRMQNQERWLHEPIEGTNLENTPPLRACAGDRGVNRSCISGYGIPPFLTRLSPPITAMGCPISRARIHTRAYTLTHTQPSVHKMEKVNRRKEDIVTDYLDCGERDSAL